MTIIEASLKLYEWFSEKDSFSLESDFKKFSPEEEADVDKTLQRKAAVNCALLEYEEMGLIKSSEVNKKKIWTLKKSFDSFDQTLKISPDTCLSVAQILNGVNNIIDIGMDECDPKNLTEKDIKHLIMICSTLIQMSSKRPKE